MRLPFPSEVAKLFVGADMFVEGSAAYRLMKEIAADRGRQYGAGSIELWLHEADNRRALRAAAEAFGKARGYTWGFSMRSHPRVPQIAERPLS